MGQSIQEWTKYNLWKTAFKKFEGIWSAVRNVLGIFQPNFGTIFADLCFKIETPAHILLKICVYIIENLRICNF